MFLVIQNDTINLSDISRISRESAKIKVYFISENPVAEYDFDTENSVNSIPGNKI